MPVSIISNSEGSYYFENEINEQIEKLEARGKQIINISISTNEVIGAKGNSFRAFYACILYKD